jgi:hypothetical protein
MDAILRIRIYSAISDSIKYSLNSDVTDCMRIILLTLATASMGEKNAQKQIKTCRDNNPQVRSIRRKMQLTPSSNKTACGS